MPLYEYRCQKCGEVTEVLQKINDPPLRRCGQCSGKMERLISRTSFHLKGGGWFAHGYGQGSSGNSGGSGSGGGSSEAKSTEGKSTEGKSTEGKSSEAKSTEGKSSAKKSESEKGDSKKEGTSGGGDSGTKASVKQTAGSTR